MRKINKSQLTLAIAFSFLISPSAFSMEIPLAGKILMVEDDGTAWIETEEKYQKSFDEIGERALQNFLHRPYRVFRFHIHGTDVGYAAPDKNNAHYSVTTYAISTLKKNLQNKRALLVCVEINKDSLMPSCITEVDKKDIGVELLRDGLANSNITSETPIGYAKMLLNAEEEAKKSNTGVWSSMLGLFGKSL